jgi:hypothetical protein
VVKYFREKENYDKFDNKIIDLIDPKIKELVYLD